MQRLFSLDELETACQAQWREGAVDTCRLSARQLRERAREAEDWALEARAEWHLALCDQREARYPRALAAARRAAALARVAGDAEQEVEALSLVCAAAAALGRYDDAIEAGCLARQLADDAGQALVAVQAADALGLAYAWMSQPEAARACFADGLARAACTGRVDWEAHLRINAALAEALMLALHWDPAQGRPADERLRPVELALDAALARCEVAPGVMAASTQRSGRFLIGWVQVMLACWQGEVTAAAARLQTLRTLVRQERAWLAALVGWAAVTVAACARDWRHAESEARSLLDQALEMGHAPLADAGRRLLVLALTRQGRVLQALTVLQDVVHQAAAAGSGGVASPEADLALEMAAFELRLRALQRPATELPAWRRDDALTGVASREHFQAEVDALLQRADPARAQVSLLVLAPDPGQLLAGHHSPLVRDRVLCTLAALLRQVLRAGDLPARWSHDELAALLLRAGGEDATRVAARVQAAVAAHDWSAIAPGLAVRVSLGHASAREGDTLGSLMRRCESTRFARLRREHRRVADDLPGADAVAA